MARCRRCDRSTLRCTCTKRRASGDRLEDQMDPLKPAKRRERSDRSKSSVQKNSGWGFPRL